jgi:hypothetical protein
MRKYSTNLSFIDMLFNISLGFLMLFILAYLLINPIADAGKIDPEAKIMITLRWDNESIKDMDLWVKGPDGTIVSFQRKDGRYIILDRDDLGRANDIIMVDGVEKVIARNIETIMITDLMDGEYIVSVHHFSGAAGITTVNVDVVGLSPYKIWYAGSANLTARNEKTMVTFIIKDGKLIDIRTDLQIPLRPQRGAYAG